MTADADYCEQLVREADKNRFLATLFAPAARRPALFSLYAFNAEIARVRDVAREPMPGEIRLQWWREVLEGGRSEEARAHPVAAALLETMADYRLPAQSLTELVDAHAFDLYDDPMPTLAHADAYGFKTSSVIFELAGKILYGSDAAVSSLARQAGIAYALAEQLRLFPRHAARRQLFVPLDILQRYGANAEDVFAGKATLQLRAALAEMRLHIRGHLTAADDLLSTAPASVLPAFLPIALVRPLLKRMERRGYDPFGTVDVPQWRRQWALWRAARRPRAMAAR
ncbi:MAG: 15-cis-phytoene synthase [Alphaproteobacteria bacterium]|nr:15-cis-phytoene synthase [Alphaproteobacteria bacterium]